jgi:hypothetical protein
LASEPKPEPNAAMTLPKRNWMEMTWQEVAAAETARWIAVLPLAESEIERFDLARLRKGLLAK